MIQWNNINYKTQSKILDILDILEDCLLKQYNCEIQDAIAAAIMELETWSNRPCPVLDEDEVGQFIAQAADWK